jgi:hypothetical protein
MAFQKWLLCIQEGRKHLNPTNSWEWFFAPSQHFLIYTTVPYSGVLKMCKSIKLWTLIHFTITILSYMYYTHENIKKWSSWYWILVFIMVIISSTSHSGDVGSARLACDQEVPDSSLSQSTHHYNIFHNFWLSKLVQAVTLSNYIWMLPGSNLVRALTTLKGFSWFS